MMDIGKANPFENIDADAADLSDFSPKISGYPVDLQERAREKAAVTDLAVQSGFKINNFEEKPIKAERRVRSEASCLKTLRLNTADYNRFRGWCNKNGYSAAAGFKILTEELPKRKSQF